MEKRKKELSEKQVKTKKIDTRESLFKAQREGKISVSLRKELAEMLGDNRE